jgi:hypothetical protein
MKNPADDSCIDCTSVHLGMYTLICKKVYLGLWNHRGQEEWPKNKVVKK